MALAAIPETDRQFFEWVAAAVFANPFGELKSDLDLKIATAPFKTESDRLQVLHRAVARRIEPLVARERADIRRYSGRDFEVMRNVFLFEAYHAVAEQLDQHIEEQVKRGDSPLRVPFADETLELLGRRGFSPEQALRFLALFFQIRRAYHFVARDLVGDSACMKAMRHHLWENVFTHDIRWYDQFLWNRMEDFSTLLLGETGTGKGTAAAAIGRSGFIPFDESRGCFKESFTHSFVSLNLSQYPETLIESELFGHKKGAFTGAVEAHEGIFARCSTHGAIFLDEIGDVSGPVQIKLLQVLQERTFSPVGSHAKERFRGRVIAATNRSLSALREAQVFRDDFFYRLCSDVITVPSLRQRLRESPSELRRLVAHLIHRMTDEAASSLTDLVMDAVTKGVGRDYPWPGNVRELEQAIRRILVTGRYDGDQRGTGRDLSSAIMTGFNAGTLDADTLLSGYCRLLYSRHNTIEEVSRRTNLDRRTVKRYLAMPVGQH